MFRLSWKAGNNTEFWGKSIQYGFKNKLGTRLSKNRNKFSDFIYNGLLKYEN
jgi:hypothetical protein